MAKRKRRIGLKVFGVLLLSLLGFVLYTFWSTGFFRNIENRFDGEILRKVNITGVEDMQISYEDDFILLSADDRRATHQGNPVQGHLYYMDLQDENPQPVCLTTDLKTPFHPHGISMIKTDTQKYKVYVINHVEKVHTIEVFDLYNDSLVFKETLKHETMISPNDIVALEGGKYYFTNDHAYDKGFGKKVEEYGGFAWCNVIYFDGSDFKEVADGIAYANGINFDKERNLLFVASPRYFLVKVYEVMPDGSLAFIENIDCGTGVDNIEFDPDGNIWIGCHPSLLTFSAWAASKREISPSEIIKINYKGKGDYTIESIFENDGTAMSAATVACPYGDQIYVGNVSDNHFLILSSTSSDD